MSNDLASTVVDYKLTPQEMEVARRVWARLQSTAPLPPFKVSYSDEQTLSLKPDHPSPEMASALLADALGTADVTLADALLSQLANVARLGKKLTDRELNGILAIVRGIGPRDPTEAMLATQMAAIHNATMVAARRLTHTETIAQQDSASTMLNKLARTFATQVEALKRYRSTGEQNVRVTHQHVNVAANQAVIGIGMGEGGGGENEKASQSHAPRESGPDERRPALLGHEQTLGLPLPSAGREGAPRLPHARRPRRSAGR